MLAFTHHLNPPFRSQQQLRPVFLRQLLSNRIKQFPRHASSSPAVTSGASAVAFHESPTGSERKQGAGSLSTSLLGVNTAWGRKLRSSLFVCREVVAFFPARRLIGSKFNIVRYLVFLNCSRNSSTESHASHLEVAIYLSEINNIGTLLLASGIQSSPRRPQLQPLG